MKREKERRAINKSVIPQPPKSSSGVMTGYESDDEADGAETDGSVSSRPPDIPSQRRSRSEFEREGSGADEVRYVKRHQSQSLDNTSGIVKGYKESSSADSGYEAGGEGGNRRRNCEGSSGEGSTAGDAALPTDFFDSRPDVEMEDSTVRLLPSDPAWVQQICDSEHVRVEEEYILDDESDDEDLGQSEMRQSEMGQSEMGQSEMGQIGTIGLQKGVTELKGSGVDREISGERSWVDTVLGSQMGSGVKDDLSDDEQVDGQSPNFYSISVV